MLWIPRSLIAVVALVILAAGSAPSTALAQPDPALSEPPTDSTIQVMVLGALHMANPGQDEVNPRVADVTTPERQAQIRAAVDSLLNFRPTKIAVEWTERDAATFDSLYQAYRAGDHELAPNERQQLGFRLAAQSNHEHIYPVDHHDRSFPMDTVMAYAKAHQPSFLRYFQQYSQRMKAELERAGTEMGIGEALRFLNHPQQIRKLHNMYMRLLEVGADSTNMGVMPVLAYYDRNLNIFANLTAVTEPGDRAIIIFGVGHASFLRSFVEGHPQMTLVEPRDYL